MSTVPTAPSQIGRYRVLGVVGRGAMGVVYRGRDEALERDVALKVMAVGMDADKESRERFLREARAAARLQHPNIVTIYELGDHQGAPYMAMELLEGVDLQQAIEAGLRPNPRITLPIVLQLLAGLGHAHDAGIVHRDIKPSNVFLPRGRAVKIMDFGVARLGTSKTSTGLVVGTPNYMSPEQVRAGAIDGRSDLFSAALILYELVTGEKAFQADSVVSLLYKIVHETPDLSLLPQGGGWKGVRAILEKGVAPRPEDRYPDAHAMAADLSRALQDLGGPADVPDLERILLRKVPRLAQSEATTTPSRTHVPDAAPTVAAPIPPPSQKSRSRVPIVVAGVGTAALLGWGLMRTLQGPAPLSVSSSPQPLATVAPGVTVSPASVTTSPAASAAITSPAKASATVSNTVASETVTQSLPSSFLPTAEAPRRSAPAPPVMTKPIDEVARVERANALLEQGRFQGALNEARLVLRQNPTHPEARSIAEEAQANLVVEEQLKRSRAALRKGDRDGALNEARKGLAVAPNDRRLLEIFREASR